MRYIQRFSRLMFPAALLGLGVLGMVYGDFALQWQPVPEWVPGREYLAYGCALLLLVCGVGLLIRRTSVAASRILLVYLLLWLLLLKFPRAVMAPWVEAYWLGCGEIAVLVAAGWVLFAAAAGDAQAPFIGGIAGENGLRIAKFLFALALIPIGLSHIFYVQLTADYVPAWLPDRTVWAYLTGAAHLAAAVGVLFSIYPRLAASLEACMMSLFTILVWIPGVVTDPTDRIQWTALVVSATIACAAWVVAGSLERGRPLLHIERVATRATPLSHVR